MVGMLCMSKAGHDKGKIYVIIEENGEYVYMSDGDLKPKDKMKKKSKKHIQPIKKTVDASLQNRLQNKEAVRDEEIKRVIKLYRAKMIQEENICQNPM